MRAPFATHMNELRHRLLRVLAVFALCFGLLYAVKEQLLALLIHPVLMVLPAGQSLVYSSVGELFFTYIKLSALGAFAFTLPLLVWQLWRFALPGLYPHEKQRLKPYLVAVPLLFYLGGFVAFTLVIPLALRFFLGFVEEGVYPLPGVQAYLGFVMNMLLAFGLSFEFPAVLVLMMQTGLLKVESLVHNRRVAIVLVFVVAAILTPPDPLSQTLLALPMLFLYEAAIVVGKRMKITKRENKGKSRD